MAKQRRRKPCIFCGGPTIRIDRYDGYACRSCMKWTDAPCSDASCDFCKDRPTTPENVNWNDPWNS